MDGKTHKPVIDAEHIVGGGFKKVGYTLDTVRKVGVGRSAKALRSKNACKACGLGMGGQLGGMTNELGEFPSVCNKSIQTQLSDLQPPIDASVFDVPVTELKTLDGQALESLGRLDQPIYKSKGEAHYRQVSWDWALDLAAERLKETIPERSFFYSSGRSSNEAGYLFQLLGRLWGTQNIHNCSYYCHQATGVGLKSTLGTSTATVELADLKYCDLVFVIGANPASNHPRFIHQLKALRERGGQVIVINPAKEPGLVKFAVPKSPRSLVVGGNEIASEYLQPLIGSDVALLKGIAKAVIEKHAADDYFILNHTEGFEAYCEDIKNTQWQEIVAATDIPEDDIRHVADLYCASRNAVFCWGMGVTHHLNGVDNVESIANLALLRGMVGKPYSGLLPLRGHSNVQGIGTIGVKPVLVDDVIKRMESSLGVTFATSKGMDTMQCLHSAHEGDIDAAVMMGGNLYGASPSAEWAEEALANIDFKLFLTTTLNLGHVHGVDDSESLVLPVTARDEEWQPTTQESMFNYVRLSDGGIDRLSTVRPEVDILADIGKRLIDPDVLDFGQFKNHKTLRASIAAVIPGMEKLADIDDTLKEFHIKGRLKHRPEFDTPTGKAQFRVCPTPEIFGASDSNEYRLMSVRSEGQFNTIVYEYEDTYRGVTQRDVVFMSPLDMEGLGLSNGDLVDIESDTGRLAGFKVHAFNLPESNLMMYYPESNALTGLAVDPRSGTPAFKSVSVRLSPHRDDA